MPDLETRMAAEADVAREATLDELLVVYGLQAVEAMADAGELTPQQAGEYVARFVTPFAPPAFT